MAVRCPLRQSPTFVLPPLGIPSPMDPQHTLSEADWTSCIGGSTSYLLRRWIRVKICMRHPYPTTAPAAAMRS